MSHEPSSTSEASQQQQREKEQQPGWVRALGQVTSAMQGVQSTLAESVGAVAASMSRTTEMLATVNRLMEHHLIHGVHVGGYYI